MPHVSGDSSGSGGDDLASSDEIKVFKDEGEEIEEEKLSRGENLSEEKTSLVTESEDDKSSSIFTSTKSERIDGSGSTSGHKLDLDRPMPYLFSPYYPNGSSHFSAMAGKMGMVAPPHPGSSPLSFMMYNHHPEHFQPPPAHMGISPVHIDPKTGMGRPSLYPLTTPSQYSHMFSSELMQWHHAASSLYPSLASAGFRSSPGYPSGLPVSSAASLMSRFSPSLLGPHHSSHPGLAAAFGHPLSSSSASNGAAAIIMPGPKQEILPQSIMEGGSRHSMWDSNHNALDRVGDRQGSTHHSNNLVAHNNHINSNSGLSKLNGEHGSHNSRKTEKKHSKSSNSNNPNSHIKKPLNAFMLYMKETRAQVVAECTLKESAAINQILGRKWHALGRDEQAKYYDLARKERQIHMQMYPGWSARDNYAQVAKKQKKRKREKSLEDINDSNNPKKCRARFGLDHQGSWCKPCRRKKKCIRYLDALDGSQNGSTTNPESGDDRNIASVSSSCYDNYDSSDRGSSASLSSPQVPGDLDPRTPGTPMTPLTPGPLTPSSSYHPLIVPPSPHYQRGNNPHDINNPLNVSHLTGQLSIKRSDFHHPYSPNPPIKLERFSPMLSANTAALSQMKLERFSPLIVPQSMGMSNNNSSSNNLNMSKSGTSTNAAGSSAAFVSVT